MSDHLPDDVARWPTNPYELLAVQPGVTPRDLRKAYTNLIRIYKPEHRPDQFRKIREAFETIQRYGAFYSAYSVAPETAEPAPRQESTEQETQPAQPSTESASENDPAPECFPRPPNANELWTLAVSGQPSEAYRGLMELVERSAAKADVFARLYWLAVLYPEVDTAIAPSEWLSRGLDRTGFSRILLELYASEIRHNPSEAAQTRFNRLFDRARSSADLVAIARLRWEALCRIEEWEIVHQDLDRVATGVRNEDEVAWLILLTDVLRWIAWGRGSHTASSLRRRAREGIRGLNHLGLRHAFYFDQVDWLDALIESWQWIRERRSWSRDFLTVLRDGWAQPIEQIRPLFEEVLRHISEQPLRWVEWFDSFGPEGTAALVHFDNLINLYQGELGIDLESPHTPERLRKLATKQIAEDTRQSSVRTRALRFCLDEYCSPDLIKQSFDPAFDGPTRTPRWVAELADDVALQLVCRACRVFRA